MSIQRFFKRYVQSSVKLFCFFILVNIVLFLALVILSASRGNRSSTKLLLSQIAGELQLQDGRYTLSNNTRIQLEQAQVWCMLIDNENGGVVWDYQLPPELPRQYTYGDIAQMTRWYLEDYPVFVSNCEDGLLVVGFPKDSFWKLSTYKTVSSIKIDIAGFIVVFLLNILIVLLLFIVNSRKIEKSIKPILIGIEEISAGRKTRLTEQGELAEINTKLNKVANALQRRDAARANWISGISHDIRTPLSMVLGYSSSLESSQRLLPDEQKKIAAIRQQAETIKRLIEDLNLTSKLEYDMQPLQIENLHPVELAREVICSFLDGGLKDCYFIDFVSDPQSEMEIITGDQALIKRALQNLIQNSVTHNPNGCSISVAVLCNENGVTITVSDDGIGVSADKLKDLNRKKYCMESSDEKLNLRHVLGILLVRQIIEAHNGTMKIESVPQNGYQTVLTFPNCQV